MSHSPRQTSNARRYHVYAEHIELAKRKNSGHCMIADAILERHPHITHRSADVQTIRFSDKIQGKRYTYLTPRTVQVAILRFDHGREVLPFSFNLPQPAHVAPINKRIKSFVTVPDKAKSRIVRNGGKPIPRSRGFNTRREFGVKSIDLAEVLDVTGI